MNIAIAGFGCAGYHALEAIRANAPDAAVDVYTDVDHPPANPMLTTYYVKGAIGRDAMFPFGDGEEISARHRASIRTQRVTGLDGRARALRLADGSAAHYDRILIATGADAFAPPIDGIDLPGVLVMRTPADAQRLRELLERGETRSALVIGASMTGIKVAELMHLRGISCTMVDGAPHLFALAAFPQTARRIERRLARRGIELGFGEMLCAIRPREGGGLEAEMKSGSRYAADVVAVCIGTRARVDFLRDSGVTVNRGVSVDERMQTNLPGIYAAGDCCEAPELQSGERRIVGLWANAAAQGRVAGAEMTGARAAFGLNILQNISHFLDVDFVGMGDPSLVSARDEIVEFERGELYLRAARGPDGLRCVNLLGCAEQSGRFKSLFVKSLLRAQGPDDLARCALLDAGVPADMIDFLGGSSQ